MTPIYTGMNTPHGLIFVDSKRPTESVDNKPAAQVGARRAHLREYNDASLSRGARSATSAHHFVNLADCLQRPDHHLECEIRPSPFQRSCRRR